MTRIAILIVAGLALTLGAACSGDDDDGGSTPTATSTPTPTATEPANGGNGGGGGDGTVQGVEPSEYYTANCAACHGADRSGIVGPALLPDSLVEDDAFYADVIANGRAGTVMPAWAETAGLTDGDIAALIAFLRTAP